MATFTNTATLSYNDTTTVSNTVTGELLDVLSATKTAVRSVYGCNDTVTYLINLINSGTTAFTGLTLTDNLGAYAFGERTLVPLTYKADSLKYFVNGIPAAVPTVTSAAPLTVTGITVPAGGNITVAYETALNEFAPREAGSSIRNTITASGVGIITPLTAEETITAESAPCLMISKSLSPTTVIQNGELTYTFLIQNSGSAAATVSDNLTVSDTFAPVLCDINVTLDGTPLTAEADYSYVAGLFKTVSGRITVPAATYSRNAETGAVIVTPGTAILRVTGTVCS